MVSKIIIGAIIVICLTGIVGVLNVAKTQVPYTEQECANVQVPYASQLCSNKEYAYNVKYTTCDQFSPGIIFTTPAKVTCTVNNLQNQAGTFFITYGFIIAGVPVTQSESASIYASSSASRTYSYNGQIQNCYCSATAPTYQDCQAITAYKTETQCHDITKYRSISLWQSMFG
jgi:hypothetical protein